ncbi:hypothetical protein D3C80_1815290 [compost metagenome]
MRIERKRDNDFINRLRFKLLLQNIQCADDRLHMAMLRCMRRLIIIQEAYYLIPQLRMLLEIVIEASSNRACPNNKHKPFVIAATTERSQNFLNCITVGRYRQKVHREKYSQKFSGNMNFLRKEEQA